MKDIFKINTQNEINAILDSAEYGTLALSKGIEPYSVPVNFVRVGNVIYLHGSKKGRKMSILKHNKNVSFSVVEPYSLIPSYFSSKDALACPATHFFGSVIIDGFAIIVENRDEKVEALSAIMQKYQKEGGYKELDNQLYNKAIDATEIIKIIPHTISGKSKLGQHLKQDRFDMIITNLKKRASQLDLQTVDKMIEAREIGLRI